MPNPTDPPDGVVCYWKFRPGKRPSYLASWDLAQSYLVDAGARPLVASVNTPGSQARWEWENWLYDTTKEAWAPRRSRAVTIWDYEHGPRLVGFHLPGSTYGLAPTFFADVLENPQVWKYLDAGFMLLFGTTEEAKRLFQFDPSKAP